MNLEDGIDGDDGDAMEGDGDRNGDDRDREEMYTCLIVIAGFHPSSSFKIDKQTVPEGYTFG